VAVEDIGLLTAESMALGAPRAPWPPRRSSQLARQVGGHVASWSE